MKNTRTYKASGSLLGALLLLSFFGTISMASMDIMSDFYVVCKTQWHNFSESLSMLQPHRTHFP